ncbi:hypothetical protein OIU77_019339 [Salix suchowensis]|uniref:Protein kinase domain-containing protein n=1 Tax=Salix suchowensis TaxID=1278906 RepID=A0ABQ9CFM8_9ROSI|nr:hypothetical protein OIU77_019339 [Salix suchowensis]
MTVTGDFNTDPFGNCNGICSWRRAVLSEFARMGDSARMRLGSSFNNLYLASAIVMPCKYVTICDFGYSKSSVLHSQPKSTVGTPAYIAPEVLMTQQYDGKQ